MVLRCLILLGGGGGYDGGVQVSAELADNAFQERRGQRGGAAAFGFDGVADELGGVSIPVVVELGDARLNVGDLLSLAPGDVIFIPERAF